jgi:hypothetical protein
MIDIQGFHISHESDGIRTESIQSAIDACFEAGGGTVKVPAGRYRIGTISLRSNVNLHLESGAVLEGSSDLADYPAAIDGFVDAVGQRRSRCLIAAVNAERVSISGRGVIDGRGGTFARDLDDRPFLVRFIGCRDVSMTDVTLRDSAAWVSHYMECDTVHVRGVTIRSRVNGNNDGIDVDACRNVRISDCDIDTGDDAICIKSTTGGACRNVAVSHCILKSDWAALKLGTESAGDFQNILLSHCIIYDTNGGGLKLITTDGGRMENVMVSDLIMHRVSGPIFIRLGNRLRTYRGEATKRVGSMRNITLRGIRADVWEEGFALWGKTRRAGICITGVPEHPIEGLTLEHIHLTYPGGGTIEEAGGLEVPELGDHYPEFTIFTPLPAYGFYLRHARGVTFRSITIETVNPDARPAIVMDDVEDVSVDSWQALAPPDHVRARVRNARKVQLPWRDPKMPSSTQSDAWEQW